jgi:hypothetical protein
MSDLGSEKVQSKGPAGLVHRKPDVATRPVPRGLRFLPQEKPRVYWYAENHTSYGFITVLPFNFPLQLLWAETGRLKKGLCA